jgi:hypothetical protein
MKEKKYTAGSLRLCIDRILPEDMRIAAARRAIEVNPKNDPGAHMKEHRRPGVPLTPLGMAIATTKHWPNGHKLGITFLDGSTAQKTKVRKHAEEWLPYANLSFDWNAANAALRISFVADSGSWSAVGTDCLHEPSFPKDEPTMNFGWLRDDTDDVEYRRVVVHEFGHALGAIHEHQNPKGGIEWNVQAVIDVFSGPPNNWSPEQIRSNIIDKYRLDQLNATAFDPGSIMLYHFPPQLIAGPPALAASGTPNNTSLSPGDKGLVSSVYPKV